MFALWMTAVFSSLPGDHSEMFRAQTTQITAFVSLPGQTIFWSSDTWAELGVNYLHKGIFSVYWQFFGKKYL